LSGVTYCPPLPQGSEGRLPSERVKIDRKRNLPSNPPRKVNVFERCLHSAAEVYQLLELGGSTQEAQLSQGGKGRLPLEHVKINAM